MPPPPADRWTESTTDAPNTATIASPRASRSRGTSSNRVAHRSFIRPSSTAGGLDQVFSVGDTVLVGGPLGITRQKWLAAPDWQIASKALAKSRARSKGKAQAKGKQKDVAAPEAAGWRVEDGLQPGHKIAVITALSHDLSTNTMLCTLRWFARPCSLWGEQGPEEGEEVDNYELYYVSDSAHLEETRRADEGRPGARRPDRTPLHTDELPLGAILSHVQVLTPSDLVPPPASLAEPSTSTSAEPFLPSAPTLGPTSFLIRKVYDAKPLPSAHFLGEIDYLEIWQRGVKEGEWDVEAILSSSEASESEDEGVRRKGKGRGKEKRKKGGSRKATPSRSVSASPQKKRQRKIYDERGDDSSSSEDSSDEENPTFRISRRQESSSEDEGTGSDTSADSDPGVNLNEDVEMEDGASSRGGKKKRKSPTKSKPRAKPARSPTKSKVSPSKPSTSSSKRIRPMMTSASRIKASAVAAKKSNYLAKRSSASAARSSASSGLPTLFARDEAFKALPPSKQAQALLHVSATPEFLPCREEQREEIGRWVAGGVLGETGGCLYIHGVPGTGKTATVYSVVRELQGDADITPFTFVEINGLKISEPAAAFSILWESISSREGGAKEGGRKLGPKQALAKLEEHFQNPTPGGRGTTVVLIDELDQMLTKRQEVVYNFFNWPHLPHSRLIVIAVANTMDLPERELGGKVRSRLGSNRIVFTPYKWDELSSIINARLAGVKGGAGKVFADRAVEHIAKRVAGGAGDARRALDIARRTVEKVEQENVLLLAQGKPPRLCTISDASATYREMTDYGSNAFVKGASLMEKVFLLSLAQVVKRRGVVEVELDEILAYHLRFLAQTSLLAHPPTQSSLFAIVASLHSQRLIAAESQRGDYYQRVRMLVGTGELFEVLREDEELKGWVPKV